MNKIIWDELSKVKQILTVIAAILVALTTIGGSAWATYSHFQTDDEAQAARAIIIAQHEKDKQEERDSMDNWRVDQLEAEAARYEKDNLDPNLPQVEREFNKRQIEKIDKKIECIQRKEC